MTNPYSHTPQLAKAYEDGFQAGLYQGIQDGTRNAQNGKKVKQYEIIIDGVPSGLVAPYIPFNAAFQELKDSAHKVTFRKVQQGEERMVNRD